MSPSPPPVGMVAQQANTPGNCMSLILHPDRFALQRRTSLDMPMTSSPSNMVLQKNVLPARKFHLYPYPAIAAPQIVPSILASNGSSIGRKTANFTLFPKLPLEMRYMIWAIAIAAEHQEKRFLRVAPDGILLERTEDDAEDAQLRIISDQFRRPRLVPSLLHACSYSREQAIKGYKLWGCADPITYQENSASVYVKPGVDTFFFGDGGVSDFWLLHTIVFESTPESAAADDTARANLLPQVGLIKHFAFDWELWSELLEHDAIWLCNFDSAKELTVAIRNPNHEQLDKDFPLFRMRAIAVGTIRGESAALALAMTHKAYAESKEELAEMNWPEDKIRFSVATLSLGPDLLGNTLQDERYYEDVLIEAHRQQFVSNAYLDARLKMIYQRRPQK